MQMEGGPPHHRRLQALVAWHWSPHAGSLMLSETSSSQTSKFHLVSSYMDTTVVCFSAFLICNLGQEKKGTAWDFSLKSSALTFTSIFSTALGFQQGRGKLCLVDSLGFSESFKVRGCWWCVLVNAVSPHVSSESWRSKMCGFVFLLERSELKLLNLSL